MQVDAGFDLTGRRAIVTGASAGIGAAIATRLANAGAHVVAVSRSGSAPPGAQRIQGVAADLSAEADLERVIADGVAVLGGLDILINNAGMADFVALDDIDRAHFDAMVGLNLWAPLRLCQLAHPHLQESGDGAVAMIGSIDAIRPSGGAAVYGATKAGLMGLSPIHI